MQCIVCEELSVLLQFEQRQKKHDVGIYLFEKIVEGILRDIYRVSVPIGTSVKNVT